MAKIKPVHWAIGISVWLVFAAGLMIGAYGEEVDFTTITPECKGPDQAFEATILGNKTTTVYQCLWVDVQITPPSIMVEQPNLTPEEEKVIDDANECRQDPECEISPIIQIDDPIGPDTEEEIRDEFIEKNRNRAGKDAAAETDL